MIFIHRVSKSKTILLLSYLALWFYIDDASCLDIERSHWFQVPGFGLTARVKVMQQESSKLDEEIIVREYYSIAEGRARLELTILQRQNTTATRNIRSISYFYHAQKLLKLVGTDLGTDCRLATNQQLAEDLFGSISSIDRHLTGEEWLQERSDVPDYLIGFARLLLIVDSNREKLVQTIGPSVSIRNQEAVRYTLNDLLGAASENELSQLTVYYGKSPRTSASDLPLRIWFSIKEEVEIVVDYSMVAQIDYEAAATKAIEGQNLFTFPLDSGCSGHLPLSKLVREQMAPRLISFRATVENLSEGLDKLNYFVAYDGYAGVLRIDTLTSARRSHYSITIHDLKEHLKYNIAVERSTGSQDDTLNGNGQCIVAHHQSQQALLVEPVLPLDGMVEMGRASVRGVEVVVFELLTDQLPEILFPQVSYLDRGGLNRSAYIPNLTHMERIFCVNYYFSAQSDETTGDGLWVDGNPLGQLMRIEVAQQNYPIYRIEVEDFIRELVEAPNGDRAEKLFALGDRCSGDQLRAEGSASLEMELEFKPNAQMVSLTPKEAQEMIKNVPQRSRGLVEALSRIDGLKATQIRDIESALKTADNSFRLRVSAKLDHHIQEIYKPVSVGKGRLRALAKPLPAVNFEECLWEVAHKFKRLRHLLFSFCSSSCLIDEHPSFDASGGQQKTHHHSDVFELNDDESMPCEIFSLEVISDELKPPTRNVWLKIRQNLRDKNLSIPAPSKEQVVELILGVGRLEIFNDRWSSMSGNPTGGSRIDESALKGIGLTQSSATIRVDAKESTGFNSDGLPVQSMSYSVCHSSCVASIGCKSFSLCSSSSQLECFMSDLEFRDVGLLGEIEQKSAELKTRAKRGTIVVQVASKGPDEMNDDASEPKYPVNTESVELRVDRRCRLYNKRALELFRIADMEITTELRNKSLVAADSEEHCAEICLSRNRHFFKRAARSKSLLFEGQDSAIDLVAQLRAQEERNLRSWCSSFAFIDLGAGILPDSVRGTIDPVKLTKNGLCHIAKQPEPIKILPPASREPSEKRPEKVKLHKYDFIYSSLYEPQHGIRLLALAGKKENDTHELSLEESRKHIYEHNDQAFVGARDLETCARLCFMQNTPVKPLCRSFGFMKYNLAATNHSSDDDDKPRYYCVFNSITATDAMKSPIKDHIMVMTQRNVGICHYEPREFLSLENVYVTKLYKTGADETSEPFRLGTPSLLFIILMALISGVAFTTAAGDRIMDKLRPRRESIENPSRSFLNSLVEGDSDVTHRSFEEEIVLPDLVLANQINRL